MCDVLRSRSKELIDNLDMGSHPKSEFSTEDQVCKLFVFVNLSEYLLHFLRVPKI